MSLFGKLKDLFIDVEEIEIDEPEEIIPKKSRKEEKKELRKEKKQEELFKEDNFMELKSGQTLNNMVNEEIREVPFKIPKVMEEDIKKKEATNNDEMFAKFNEEIKENNQKEYKEMIPKTREVIHKQESFMKFENPYAIEEEKIKQKKQEEKKVVEPPKVADLYKDPEGEKKSTTFISKKKETGKTAFKASPVISPIYGVLDKNYKNEELITISENSYELQRLSKKIDFDTVRRKAYGNLSEEVRNNLCEDCELLKEVKKLEKMKETELLYDMIDDDKSDEVGPSLEDAYDNFSDLGVSYEKIEDKIVVTGDEVIINNNNDKKVESEEIEVKTSFNDINKNSNKSKTRRTRSEKNKEEINNKEENEIEEDLFGLIDSMYEEKGE